MCPWPSWILTNNDPQLEVTASLLGGPEINNCYFVLKSYSEGPRWVTFVPGGSEWDPWPGVCGSMFLQCLVSSGRVNSTGSGRPCLLVPQFTKQEGPYVISHHPLSHPHAPVATRTHTTFQILGSAVTTGNGLAFLRLWASTLEPLASSPWLASTVLRLSESLKLLPESKGSEAQTQWKQQWILWNKHSLPTQHRSHGGTEVWLLSAPRPRLQ